MQRLSDETGLFAAALPAETTQIRELGAHVFDIFIVKSACIYQHNYGEWVVGTTGIEPVTPTLSRSPRHQFSCEIKT
jgi:hypothetical protein